MKNKQTIKQRILRAFEAMGRARARRELLKLSPRTLTDVGFSVELLESGVDAWPWRLERETLKPMLFKEMPVTILEKHAPEAEPLSRAA